MPEPREIDQTKRLDEEDGQSRLERELAVEVRVDGCVAGAERAWHEVTTDADHDGTKHRPPHPVNRDVLENLLPQEYKVCENGGGYAADDAKTDTDDEHLRAGKVSVDAGSEEALGANQIVPEREGNDAGDGNGDQAAWLPFE